MTFNFNKYIVIIMLFMFGACTSKVNVLNTISSDSLKLPESQVNSDGDLVGTISKSMLLSKYPNFLTAYQNYQVDGSSLTAIKGTTTNFTVLVVLGTWCPDSESHVGEFLKISDLFAKNICERILIGIDRIKSFPEQIIEKFDIVKVPTFIIFSEGREIGRITEHPENSIESDILDIVAKENQKEK